MQKKIAWMCGILLFSGTAWAQDSLIVKEAYKQVALSGYTRCFSRQTLASEMAGKVMKVHYDVGQPIGQLPFLEMDTTFIDLQIDQTRWSLEKLKLAKSRVMSRVAFLEKEFQRIDRLHKDDAATESRRDASAEELRQANFELQTTDFEMSSLNTQHQELVERRRRYRLFAPQGWVVVERRVEPGEIIAAGTPLARVADYGRLTVPLFVSGQELKAIQRHNVFDVKVDGIPAKAKLNFINPEFDERTRKLAIELIIAEFAGEHRGGLLAELPIEVAGEGLMVPRAAVSNRYDNPRVLLKSSGQSIAVVILGESGGHVLIADHPTLSPGMELLAVEISSK